MLVAVRLVDLSGLLRTLVADARPAGRSALAVTAIARAAFALATLLITNLVWRLLAMAALWTRLIPPASVSTIRVRPL